MSLKNNNFKPNYYKGENDIANDFYIPCLKTSKKYFRITGYFSSSIFTIAWSGLREFIKNDGKIKIITSPRLGIKDIEALDKGSEAKKSSFLQKKLSLEIDELINNPKISKPATILTSLYALGKIEFKIADFNQLKPINSSYLRMMHDKTGIFKDLYDNLVSFNGSMNETYLGLSNDGNFESISVSISWDEGRDKLRTLDHLKTFEKIWTNKYDDLKVEEFSNFNIQKLKDHALPNNSWENILVDLEKELVEKSKSTIVLKEKIQDRELRIYQSRALENWKKNNYVGIFKHITGSGKTFTALNAIRLMIEKHKIPIVLVPSINLQEQWKDEINKELNDLDIKIVLCGGGNSSWKQSLDLVTRLNSKINFLILAIMNTAASDNFLSKIIQGEHLFLVVDEMHNLGSKENSKIMDIHFGPKLGLSATPERDNPFGGQEETERMFNFFSGSEKKGIVDEFTIDEAINTYNVLSRYRYEINFLNLNSSELENYEELSLRISQHYARNQNNNQSNNNYIHNLLIRRSDILKKAEAKIPLSKKIVSEGYHKSNSKWIVYCDDTEQLNRVHEEIKSISKEKNFQIFRFLSNELSNLSQRKETLKDFDNFGGLILSCTMLDEGLDIPSVSSGLLLASSKSNREFIQRRGRVLRKDPHEMFNRKKISYIYDTIIIPRSDKILEYEKNIINTEFGRAFEFSKFAENKSFCQNEINSHKIRLGIE